MKQAKRKAIPFRGQLQSVITRKMGKSVRLTAEEKEELLEKGITPPKTRKVRRRELDGLFLVYSAIISPDEFLLQVLTKETNFKNYKVGLLSKFEVATKYLKLRFEDSMSESFRQDIRRMATRVEGLEAVLTELAKDRTPVEVKLKKLKSHVSSADYKNKLVMAMAEVLEDCFKLLGIPVSTRQKRNAGLSLPYIQFSLASKLESAMNKASKSEIETYEKRKRTLKAQEAELTESLQQRGFVVRKSREFTGGGVTFATIAYNPEVVNLGKPPKKPYRNREMSDAVYEELLAEYKQDLEQYNQSLSHYIEEIYAPELKDPTGTSYKKYTTMVDFRKDIIAHQKKKVMLSQQFPKIETIKIQTGTKTVEKKVRGSDEVETIEEPIYEFQSKITFGDEENGNAYELPQYDVEEAFGELERTQITDGEGDSARALTRVMETRKILVNDQEQDVIVSGRYKGFLVEDMVNSMGRLIEGTYFSHNSKGEKVEIEMIDNVYVDNTMRSSRGKALGDVKINKTKDTEVSFLELGEKTEAGYRKVLNNRLKEPYITLAQDKARLILGIPSTEAHTVDRNLVKELAKIMPGLEQKKDPRLSATINGRNPFYYLDAPTYEAVRNTLGSVALSKKAMNHLEDYYKELLARDRALDEENVKRFNASEVGGFVDTFKGKPFNFNNKQREAMAWMEANGYSGMMALDTGVGKTLLAGGAMMHYINHKEGGGGTKKFLFVSPKRLQGNFSREMATFLKDKNVIVNRIEEMNYNKFAMIVRGIDRLQETLKMPEGDKKQRRLRAIPQDFWKNEKTLTPAYKDSTSYFKAVYQMCFFDEVNEALTGTKRKAISEMKHPHKILLSASSMEKDPLDLYRFVAVAKGDTFSKEKERAFMERFGNVIGGRFVGLKKDPQVRQEFNTWVKANAYFADKQEVDLSEINMPKLLVPTEETITIKMDKKVADEYKKVAKSVQRELKAMVKKYRDVLTLGEDYRDSAFQDGKKAIQDFAMGSVKKLESLITLSTNPAKYFGDRSMPNPKIEQSEQILLARPGKRVCYFCSDASVVRQNAVSMSQSGVGGVHAALVDQKIEFFRAGKKIGEVDKKTGKTEIGELDRLMRTASSMELDYSFIDDPVYADKVRDFKELTEANIELYKDNLEEEELATIQGAYGLLVGAVRERSVKKVKSAFKKLDATYFKTFDFIADQWAVDVAKTTIRDNPNIKTLSCTDAYAKGFNFQFIDTIVHLDRGKGFDSELVKQRTARAYRTGQDKQVEVLYLDSMLDGGKHTLADIESDEQGNVIKAPKKDPENISLDELKALVQQVDQKFFMDVIKQGQETNLIDNYESVRRTTGTIVNVNKNLLAQILNPTAENIASMAEQMEIEEVSPIKTAVLSPERFANQPALMEAVREGSQMSGRSLEEIKDAVDASGVTALGQHHFGSNPVVMVDGNAVISEGKFAKMSVEMKEEKNGEVTIHNDYMTATPCAPKDTLSKIIFGQVANALAKGVSSKITTTLRSNDPTPLRMGFSAKVDLPFISMADEALTKDEVFIKEWLDRYGLITDNGKVEISSLFACVKSKTLIGQKWWKENAGSVALPSTGVLNLADKSISMRLVNTYFKMKSHQAGVSPSEYLSVMEMPFDIDDPACWLQQLKTSNPAEMIEFIFEHKKEFKIAFYALDQVQNITPPSVVEKLKLKLGKYSKIVDDQEFTPNIDPNKQSKDPLLDEAWLAISSKIERVVENSEEAMEEGDVLMAEAIRTEELDETISSEEPTEEAEVEEEQIENLVTQSIMSDDESEED